MATGRPVASVPAVTSQPNSVNPLVEVSRLDDVLVETFAEYRVTKKRDGTQTIVGKTYDGETVKMTQYRGNGVLERSISTAGNLSIEQRRVEAVRLRKEKQLRQQAIADQLGVSQKTISDDLKAMGVR